MRRRRGVRRVNRGGEDRLSARTAAAAPAAAEPECQCGGWAGGCRVVPGGDPAWGRRDEPALWQRWCRRRFPDRADSLGGPGPARVLPGPSLRSGTAAGVALTPPVTVTVWQHDPSHDHDGRRAGPAAVVLGPLMFRRKAFGGTSAVRGPSLPGPVLPEPPPARISAPR